MARAHLPITFKASVTDTALAFGFARFGRFSADYFARFNEWPSETQRRRQR